MFNKEDMDFEEWMKLKDEVSYEDWKLRFKKQYKICFNKHCEEQYIDPLRILTFEFPDYYRRYRYEKEQERLHHSKEDCFELITREFNKIVERNNVINELVDKADYYYWDYLKHLDIIQALYIDYFRALDFISEIIEKKKRGND